MAKPDTSSPAAAPPKDTKLEAKPPSPEEAAAAGARAAAERPVEAKPPAEKPLADAAAEKLALMQAQLAELLADKAAREAKATETAQDAVATTPPKVIGTLTITDRMSEAEILKKVREARIGRIPLEDAKRFRTTSRIMPPASMRGDADAAKSAGTLPLGTEIDREAFTRVELEHYLAPHVRALEAIA